MDGKCVCLWSGGILLNTTVFFVAGRKKGGNIENDRLFKLA